MACYLYTNPMNNRRFIFTRRDNRAYRKFPPTTELIYFLFVTTEYNFVVSAITRDKLINLSKTFRTRIDLRRIKVLRYEADVNTSASYSAVSRTRNLYSRNKYMLARKTVDKSFVTFRKVPFGDRTLRERGSRVRHPRGRDR